MSTSIPLLIEEGDKMSTVPVTNRKVRRGWLIPLLFAPVFLPGLAAGQYHWVDDQGNVHYSQTLSGVPEQYRSKATSITSPSPLSPPESRQQESERKPSSPPQNKGATLPGGVEPLPTGVDVTDDEVADSLRRVRELVAQTKKAEAMCLDIAVNGPGGEEVARTWQQAGQATQQARGKISSAWAAIDDLRRARGFLDVVISATDAKRAVREATEAGARARETIASARSTEHDFDLKTSGGAAVCASRLSEQRQSLEKLLQLASTNPDAFRAMVAKAKADYQATMKRQHEEFQAMVKRDLQPLLERELTIAAKLDTDTPYAEIFPAVETLQRQLSTFKTRYGLVGKTPQHPDLLDDPVLKAGDALIATFEAWTRERRASADIVLLRAQLERGRGPGASMMDRGVAVQAAHGLRDAQREEADAHTQRLAQWEATKHFLDEARKVAQNQGQAGGIPPK